MGQHETTPVPMGLNAEFVYRMEGNGMVAFGIWHGDDLYIRPQITANNGDTVIIAVDEETILVRRYCRSGGELVFMAGDPSIPSIIADPCNSPQIIGKVVGLSRRLERE